ncbi:hypothetical protein HBB16_17220 [Pseudonocardia sp. MCCB 268]|nr:hypothetical protein [Pseudonocardia cytotoxica]
MLRPPGARAAAGGPGRGAAAPLASATRFDAPVRPVVPPALGAGCLRNRRPRVDDGQAGGGQGTVDVDAPPPKILADLLRDGDEETLRRLAGATRWTRSAAPVPPGGTRAGREAHFGRPARR